MDHRTVTFDPTSLLAVSTTYTVTIDGIKDLGGRVISSYSWSFTTMSY